MIVKYFIFCFMIVTNAYAQNILIGANGLIGIINTNSTAGVGLGINGEYRFASYPFSLRLTAKIYSASFDDSPYLRGYTHGLKTLELNLLYIPFKGMMQPYTGFGIGYNFIDIHQSGNIKTVDGKSVVCKNPQNTFNYNLILGFGIAAENTLSFFMELLYSYMKLNYDVEFYVDKTIMNSSVQLNKLYLNVGFRVRL